MTRQIRRRRLGAHQGPGFGNRGHAMALCFWCLDQITLEPVALHEPETSKPLGLVMLWANENGREGKCPKSPFGLHALMVKDWRDSATPSKDTISDGSKLFDAGQGGQ